MLAGRAGVIGAFAGMFPEYQPPVPTPEAPPKTREEFHWVMTHCGLLLVPTFESVYLNISPFGPTASVPEGMFVTFMVVGIPVLGS